jgi:NADH-quinone oxidoreductase subunit C
MTAATDLTIELKRNWPEITERPSVDCPAFNVPTASLVAVLRHLRDRCGFTLLVDVTAVDWAAGASPRFSVVYHLYSPAHHGYVRVVAPCDGDEEPVAPSVVSLWPAANWHERETFDLMGVRFEGHPDLRRILMWDGYPYHPLRKEFPLAGHDTDLPDEEIADETKVRVRPAPMAGGPFVAAAGAMLVEAEPRAKDESWNEQIEKPGA